MHPLTGPVALAAALLVAAGAPKVADPTDAVGALRSVGVRLPGWPVRLAGAAEALLGLAVLAAGGPVGAALVAVSYAGFTGFVALALRTGGKVATCGCVGRPDTPPTRAHLAVTGTLALLAAGAAATGGPTGLLPPDGGEPAHAALVVAFAGLGTWLAWLVLAELPRLRPPAPAARPARR